MSACTDDFLVGEEVLILSFLFYYRYYKLVTFVERSANVDYSGACHSNDMITFQYALKFPQCQRSL